LRRLSLLSLLFVLLSCAYPTRAQEDLGYPITVLEDNMDGAYRWQFTESERFLAALDNGKLRLQLTAGGRLAYALMQQVGPLNDLYIQVEAQIERQSVYTEYGLMFRAQSRADGLSGYVFLVNSLNQYRFGVSTPSGFRVIQDWQQMSIPAQGANTLTALTRGTQIILRYNGTTLATLTDDTLIEAGRFGVVIGTQSGTETTASVLFDKLRVTVPDRERIIRIPLTLQNANRTARLLIDELQKAGLVQSSGRQVFTMSSTYVNNFLEGMNALRIAKPLLLADVLVVADVTWDSPKIAVACGVSLRAAEDGSGQMLLINKFGGVGLYQMVGSTVAQATYGPSIALHTENARSNRMIVIAMGTLTVVYVNGTWVDVLYAPSSRGALSLVSFNYEVASVRCQFDNVLVWSFDG